MGAEQDCLIDNMPIAYFTSTGNNSLLPSSLSDIFLCINTLNIDTPFHYVTK